MLSLSLSSKEETSERKIDIEKEGASMDADGNATARGGSAVPGFGPDGAFLEGSGTPAVPLPVCSPLVQISLPYSLPPMDVLRIVSFSLLLNV